MGIESFKSGLLIGMLITGIFMHVTQVQNWHIVAGLILLVLLILAAIFGYMVLFPADSFPDWEKEEGDSNGTP